MSQLVPRGPASLDYFEDYEPNMYSDWKEEKRVLLPLDGLGMGLHGHGLPTGVQTTTTPTLTLTPTTLRCFATSADLLSALDDEQPSYHNEAGFVPPIVQTSASSYMNLVDAKAWQGGTMSVTTMPMGASAANSGASQQDQPAEPAEAITVSQPLPSASPPLATTPPRRNVGGRRPNKSKGISPEEEERRQVRRDRNKAAAARCRKRRMDHTNSLLKETDGLEQKKNGLQLEIRNLNRELDELSYILEKHVCRHPRPDTTVNQVSRPEPSVSPPDIKPQVFEVKQERPDLDLEPPMKRPMLSMPQPQPQPLPQHAMPAPAPAPAPKPSRPTSLPVSSHTMLRSSVSEIAGISITTPSTGIPLNFDSLMDGGTGLTPVSGPLVPSCSSQQRNQNCVDLSSPDSNISNKLVSL